MIHDFEIIIEYFKISLPRLSRTKKENINYCVVILSPGLQLGNGNGVRNVHHPCYPYLLILQKRQVFIQNKSLCDIYRTNHYYEKNGIDRWQVVVFCNYSCPENRV